MRVWITQSNRVAFGEVVDISQQRPRWDRFAGFWCHKVPPAQICRAEFERVFSPLPESFGHSGPHSILRVELEGTMTICERCHGTGEIEREIGGDGHGNRCAGVADVPSPCPECLDETSDD